MRFSILKEIINARRAMWIFLLILIAVNVGLTLFIGTYQKPRIEELKADWLAKRSRNEIQGQVKSQAEVYSKGAEDLKTFKNRIYPKRDFTRFLSELLDLAGKDKLKVGSIVYKPTSVPAENLLNYAITLTVSGKYPAIKKFVYDVGSMNNLAVIEGVSLSTGGKTEDTVQMQVQLSSYFRMEGP
jgi:type IV pilus assembly protein PilO